jgi:predicted nucleotidyltransferase
MAKISNEIIDKILKLVNEAKKDHINISKAILFGSYAKGTNNEWSDIDLAVISDDFEGIRYFDNIKLSNSRLNSDINIETHPFKPDDFTIDNAFVSEILKYGIQIV